MQKTKINWCDLTWNPITGCDKIAQGCKNCYAESIAKRFWGDRKFTDVIFHEDRLSDKKLNSKTPKRIFVNSMSDLFHKNVTDTQIQMILDVIKSHPHHTFLVLTKRINRARNFNYNSIPNLWLGYSASTQKDLDVGAEDLILTSSHIKWFSLEPLIEPIKFIPEVHWVVVGCESGSKRRICNNKWVYDITMECYHKKIPCWVKQLQIDNKVIEDVNSFPTELQLRELP